MVWTVCWSGGLWLRVKLTLRRCFFSLSWVLTHLSLLRRSLFIVIKSPLFVSSLFLLFLLVLCFCRVCKSDELVWVNNTADPSVNLYCQFFLPQFNQADNLFDKPHGNTKTLRCLLCDDNDKMIVMLLMKIEI